METAKEMPAWLQNDAHAGGRTANGAGGAAGTNADALGGTRAPADLG